MCAGSSRLVRWSIINWDVMSICTAWHDHKTDWGRVWWSTSPISGGPGHQPIPERSVWLCHFGRVREFSQFLPRKGSVVTVIWFQDNRSEILHGAKTVRRRLVRAKQKAHTASLSSKRWKSQQSAKENIIPPIVAASRTTTRAQNYAKTLEETVSSQRKHILALQESNSEFQSRHTSLTTELDIATSHAHALEVQNAALTEGMSEIQEELSDANDMISAQSDLVKQNKQRVNRLMRDKSALSSRLASLKQELLQSILSAQESRKFSNKAALDIESLLQSIARLNTAASAHKLTINELLHDLRTSRTREKRAKSTVQRLRKEILGKSKWSGTKGRMYNSQYRTLAMAFSKAGCAQSRIGPLLSRIGNVFGIKIKRSMSRRTVGRVITEAGIKVRIQLGYELARAKALCLSSDGTSNRNVKYEARHITLKAPTYNSDPESPSEAFATRLVEVNHALDHTAQTQYKGWDIINDKIIDTYANSPLGQRDALEGVTYARDDLYRKGVAYNSDPAADVRLAARKFKERKQLVIESDLGREKIQEMSDEDVEILLWAVLQEIHDDPDGLDPNALPPEVRSEAFQALAANLGAKALDSLPLERQRLLTRMIFAGCWAHKDHNCGRAEFTGMQAAWGTLGLTPPILLANKDNAATIASERMRILKPLSVRICGDLFRHRDDKKGHQDLHRHFFSKVKFDATGEHSTVKFPDTSNTRYGSHFAGAAEILTYHSAYKRFLRIICDTKKTPGLNHSEQNALNGLENDETMEEIVVMVAYKNALCDALFAIIRAADVNHLDLAWLPKKIIEHIQKLINNTDLLLSPLCDPEEATLDGKPFPDQYAMDSVHYWAATHPDRIPVIEKLLIHFLKSTLPAWRRFTREYDDDADINSLSTAEKLELCIPSTNDANESILGALREYSGTRNGTVQHFNAAAAYHRNNTEAFAAAKLNTEEDTLYILRLARVQDASGEMKKFRDDLLAFKNRVAEETRIRQAAKEEEEAEERARLEAIHVITAAEELAKLPVKKKKGTGGACLREQLDVRRALWKDEILAKTTLKAISKKADMLAAIIAADKRRDSLRDSGSS
ncbi:hypothetical protein B0H19DRAFT_1063370 [Mycena capillaripes]|nr:hypothetical protein B0H19DRAFT_1063370 [Mycena capillaripes]